MWLLLVLFINTQNVMKFPYYECQRVIILALLKWKLRYQGSNVYKMSMYMKCEKIKRSETWKRS